MPLSTLHDVEVCVIISRKHPESLDSEKSSCKKETNPETVDAIKEVKRVSIDAGLDHFQLIPKDANGKVKVVWA